MRKRSVRLAVAGVVFAAAVMVVLINIGAIGRPSASAGTGPHGGGGGSTDAPSGAEAVKDGLVIDRR